MANGIITTNVDTLGQWINECMFQLGMIDPGDPDGPDKNNITEAQRRNIRVDKLSLVLKFTHGPDVILGGNGTWGHSVAESSFNADNYNDLANIILPADTGYIKFCPDVIGVLTSNAVTGIFNTDFATQAAESDPVSFWPDTISIINTIGETVDDNVPAGKGWGVTIGSLTPVTGTQFGGGADAEGMNWQSYQETLQINSPTPYLGGGVQGGDPIDTYLYQKTTDGSDITWAQKDANAWGTQDETASNIGYNYGFLTNIELYIKLQGDVYSESTGEKVKHWAGDTWYQLINHVVDADDRQVEDQVAGTDIDTEKISKSGWYGPTDKAIGDVGDVENLPTRLDPNDGIQDVRVRFSLAGRSTDGSSDGSWAGRNLLEWAMGSGKSNGMTNASLLPSRVSILSNQSDFNTNDTSSSPGGFTFYATSNNRYFGGELITGLNANNCQAGDTIPQSNFLRNYGRSSQVTEDDGVSTYIAYPHASDGSYFESEGIKMFRDTTGPKIHILTDIFRFNREGSGGLVTDLGGAFNTSTTIPEKGFIGTSSGPVANQVGPDNLGDPVEGQPNTGADSTYVWLQNWWTDAKHTGTSAQDGGNDSYAVNSQGEFTGSSSTDANVDEVADEYKIAVFVNQVTLVLFDPMMWWERELSAPPGAPAAQGRFGLYNSEYYHSKMIFPFKPHAQFTFSDKLQFIVPIGSSTDKVSN